jgi:hypothetical protein
MFFIPIRSGITRWIILASGSSVLRRFTPAALQELACALGDLHPLAQFEGVKIGDDYLGAVKIVVHVARNEFAASIVAVGIVRLENADP